MTTQTLPPFRAPDHISQRAARELLEAFPSPVVVFDPDVWCPLEFNDRAAQMMGYSRREFAALTISDLEATPKPQQTSDHVNEIRRNGADTFVRVHKRKDGTTIRVLISVASMEWFGRPGLMTTWHDVAELPTRAPPSRREPSDRTSPSASAMDDESYVWADARSGELLAMVDRVATTDATVLITGETGTGKDCLARRIHAASTRRNGPFVAVNCAALPEELVASELFGHMRGAYSGAIAAHKGSFEQAHGGTLFLDEVGELSATIQPKLLRVLEDRRVQPLGATSLRSIDVRILAATNRDLKTSMVDGAFRADLFYRLSTFPVHIPPLRERRDDIAVLVEHVLRRLESRLGKPLGPIAPAGLRSLERHTWPGNVRELKNVLHRAAILCEPGDFRLPTDWCDAFAGEDVETPRGEKLESWMRAHILKAMYACDWKLEGAAGAAERLGMAPSTLRYRLGRLGISRPN